MVQEPNYVRQPPHELFRKQNEPKRESFKKLPTVWHPIEELKTLAMKFETGKLTTENITHIFARSRSSRDTQVSIAS